MNKKMTINIIRFIVMLLIIIILSVVYVYASTINLDPGNCIGNGTRNGTYSQICSKVVICPSFKQNFSCNPQTVNCSYNLSCPSPIIQNMVNTTFTQIEQPIISRTFFKDNQLPIFAIVGLLAIGVAWRQGWLNKLKPRASISEEDYRQEYDSRDRTGNIPRDFKDNQGDFKELK